MTPDISIVIPAYNVSSYIGAAVQSALGQSDVELEVIVVNDGSTDDTAAVLSCFHDHRLRVIRQINKGLSAARNTGIEAASGRYIGFLDGDDIWHEGKAAEHVRAMDKNPDIDLSYSWWQLIGENGLPLEGKDFSVPACRLLGGLTFEGLLLENFVGNGSNAICRTEAIVNVGGFDPRLRSCEDVDAWLRVATLRERNIMLVPQILTSYRIRDGQMTADWRRMKGGCDLVLEKARSLSPERVSRIEPWIRATTSRFLAYIAYQDGDYPSAWKLLREAFASAPALLIRDKRFWRLLAGLSAATLLPQSWHEQIHTRFRAIKQG
jgi:glycosyltransferase involved in cell wall biosynthesis